MIWLQGVYVTHKIKMQMRILATSSNRIEWFGGWYTLWYHHMRPTSVLFRILQPNYRTQCELETNQWNLWNFQERKRRAYNRSSHTYRVIVWTCVCVCASLGANRSFKWTRFIILTFFKQHTTHATWLCCEGDPLFFVRCKISQKKLRQKCWRKKN